MTTPTASTPLGFLLDSLQAQANLDDTQVQTKERMQKIEQNQMNMEQQRRQNDILAARARQLTAPNGKPDGPDMVTMDNGTMVPLDPGDPMRAIMKNANENFNRAKADYEDSYFFGAAEHDKAAIAYNNAAKEKRLAIQDVAKSEEDKWKKTSAEFGDVKSFADIQRAVAAVDQLVSPAMARKVAQTIEKNLPKDVPWDQLTENQIRAAVAPIANMAATRGDQMRAASAAAAEAGREEDRKERKRVDDARIKKMESDEHNARERTNVIKDRAAGGGGDIRSVKAMQAAEDNIQKTLDKTPELANFSKLKEGYSAAKNVVAQIDAHGYTGTTTAETENLKKQYVQMMNNYRSMVGGKWSDQEIKKYDSTLSRGLNWIQTIGQGTPQSKQTLLDMSAEMKRVYNDANNAAVQKTLLARAKAYGRGLNPSNINSQGSIEEAKNAGAKVAVDDKGVEYLVFNDGKTKDDMYVIRKRPKPARQLVYDFGDEGADEAQNED